MAFLFWPLGAFFTFVMAYALAARVYPAAENGWDRACATIVLALAAAIAEVRLLGSLTLLRPSILVMVTVAGGAGSWLLRARVPGRLFQEDCKRVLAVLHSVASEELLWLPFAVAITAFVMAGLAAYLLPSWSWDSLGYHLPIVYDALQTGALRRIPTAPDLSYELPPLFSALRATFDGSRAVLSSGDQGYYINAYPKNVEYFFLWSRLLLPGDRMLDFCQAPFAVGGTVAISGLLARSGVSAARSLAISSLFLTIPIVALQLATNYVDVGYGALLLLAGYFAMAPPTPRALLLFGIAAGLALGSKPSAPAAVGILSLVVLVRSFGARQLAWAGAALVLCVGFGGGSYLDNWLHFGNPLFPADIHLGPLHLAGAVDVKALYMNNVPPEIAKAGFVSRTLRSWVAQPQRYVYDMRSGGFGPLLPLLLLPGFLVALSRREHRGVALQTALLSACAAATPAAFWTRYCLAVPGFLLVTTGRVTQPWSPRARTWFHGAIALLAAGGLCLAVPGFTDQRGALHPASLFSLLGKSDQERARAVSLDDADDAWAAALRRVEPGDAVAYDDSFGLVGQLWPPHGQGKIVYLDQHKLRTEEDVVTWLRAERVRVAVLARPPAPDGMLAQRRPDIFSLRFPCPKGTGFRCDVYDVMVP